MNRHELNTLLRNASIPDRASEYWNAFPGSVTRRLAMGRDPGCKRIGRVRAVRLAWAFGIATTGILLGFIWGVPHGRNTPPEKTQLAAMQKCFAEIRLLFPNQVRAILLDDREPRLLLAEEPNLPIAQPLFLEITGPPGSQRVVTFSGQRIPVNGEWCDVLVNGQGQVLVAGERWVWSSDGAVSRGMPYRIHAQPLEDIL